MDGLTRLRRSRGMSTKDLADRAKLSPTTIIDLEHGRRSANPGTLRKLASALDTDTETVLNALEPEGPTGPLAEAPSEHPHPPGDAAGPTRIISGPGAPSRREPGGGVVYRVPTDEEFSRFLEGLREYPGAVPRPPEPEEWGRFLASLRATR